MQKLFDDKIDSFKPDIKEELLNKINTNETNIDAHDERLNKLEATVATLENNIEATSKANDLVVKGIPLLSNEWPMSIAYVSCRSYWLQSRDDFTS
jgi:predicted nuclease with TOPRIM domain